VVGANPIFANRMMGIIFFSRAAAQKEGGPKVVVAGKDVIWTGA
jgi:hypothetical protein